ncbi:MAG TPA: sulfite exporter TauE/SafE family protein [Xanthobacteraceae bacterium]|jgi:uncharacterized membrane protein YfcA
MASIPLAETAWLAAAIVGGALITGLLAGLFGIGGGGIIVPVLYEVFRTVGVPEEVLIQLCVGTSIAIIVPTNVRSFLAHRRRGAVLMDIIRAWAIPAVLGVATGSAVAAFAPGAVLRIAFVVIAGVIAAKLLLGRDDLRIADDLPKGAANAMYGYLIGLAASLMGISGGSISNMILTLHGKSIHRSVATSAGLGVPITIAGAIGYMLAGLPKQAMMPAFSIGFVSFVGVVLMAPISSLVAPLGARLAHALPKRSLEIAFAVFLLAVAVRFLVTLVA